MFESSWFAFSGIFHLSSCWFHSLWFSFFEAFLSFWSTVSVLPAAGDRRPWSQQVHSDVTAPGMHSWPGWRPKCSIVSGSVMCQHSSSDYRVAPDTDRGLQWVQCCSVNGDRAVVTQSACNTKQWPQIRPHTHTDSIHKNSCELLVHFCLWWL